MADNQYQYREKVQELNYKLLDHNGTELLECTNKYYAVIDPYTYLTKNYYTKSEDIYALNIILKNYNKNYDINKINLKSNSKKMKFQVDKNTYNKLIKIRGVKGFYAYTYVGVNRDSAWWKIENIITNTNKVINNQFKKKTKNSIESQIAEKTKNNKYIYNVFKKDVYGNIYNEYLTIPQENINVRLTLDRNIQEVMKRILDKQKYYKYNQIGAILMETNTGKIKGMVQKDDSKPNINLGVATNHGFFPGSIFKVIVEEAGLETGRVSLNHIYKINSNLSKRYKGHEKHEYMNAGQALIESSNDIYAQIGVHVGIDKINLYAKQQGLFEKVLNFDEEINGIFEGDEDEVGDVELASFGQKQRITPIEAISIPNTVVNEGVYVKPYIIEAYVDNDNKIIENVNNLEKKQVLSKNIANALKSQMIDVVKSQYGTGNQAYINNIEVGGKTGTAERQEEKNKYYDGWFIGFFKVDKKYYSMIIFVENIGNINSGGNTAAPIFKDIVKEIYNYLNKF
ncbi:penicillin-binding transpeptidase domain-containing protein [Clostridium aestuarii]|uniref:Penicillin-binding transpeptidase domain-containing protein n=2 Tax=Clostridium aestuarii TaxID=338193 RepID=A0ABT4CYJ5_9CLOT|nr:penicillin-binding transpeptidase domain-containing protein [Clostridium aestuarii]MCY6484035.1 penicillin-binding transpeptidase domain-containing protein [Clostridium aestuarii]